MKADKVWLIKLIGFLLLGLFAPISANAGAYKKEFTNSIGMKMVLIPAGEFMMGSAPSGKEGHSREGPRHKVTITKAFYIGKYEVTVGEFGRFVDATGYKTNAEKGGGAYVCTGKKWEEKRDASWRNPYFTQGEREPAICVSWNDAVKFCIWLSKKDGVEYRLPTEAEWEYACRAGATTAFHYGDSLSSEQANFRGDSPYGGAKKGPNRNKTMPVGSFRPNEWGLCDMHGNAWEWCSDWYYSNYYSKSPVNDPKGPGSGSLRVLRGGGWGGDAWNCRSANRYRSELTGAAGDGGFRCVRSGAP